MSLKPFEAELGFSIDGRVTILATNGVPVGTGVYDNAPIGSIALDEVTGRVYSKKAGNGNAADWVLNTNQDDIDAILAGDWRPHAQVADIVAATLPTGTAGDPILVNGISVTDGMEVLFSNLTGGGNTYIYHQSLGTFTESSNTESVGDHVYVVHGTNGNQGLPAGGKTFVYTSDSVWVLDNQPDILEIGFIHTFIGKLLIGGELPIYTSHKYVADSDSLVAAISSLDAAAGNIKALLDTARADSEALAVTTSTVVASVKTSEVMASKLLVVVQGTGAGIGNKHVMEVLMSHNASAGTAATESDYTVYSKVKIGTITGLALSVDLNGSGVNQLIRLKVTSTASVNVKVAREDILVF